MPRAKIKADEDFLPTGIQSVEIGMDVLTTLASADGPQSLAVLARSCDMQRAKAYKYLVSLERSGYVEREAGSSRYVLGGRALQIGLAALARVDFVRIGSASLAVLSQELRQTVFLSILGEHGPTIVRWEDGGRPIAVNVRVGSVMPLFSSATGQVYGAYLHTDRIQAMIAEEIKRGEGLSVGVSKVREAPAFFAEVRKHGFGSARGTFLASIEALACPVFGPGNNFAGAITALGLKGGFDSRLEGATARLLREWSANLTERMGGIAPARP